MGIESLQDPLSYPMPGEVLVLYRKMKDNLTGLLDRAMLHNPDVYPDPFSFKPDRFLTADGQLDPSVKDPDFAVWGFGRRYERKFEKALLSLINFFQNLSRQTHGIFCLLDRCGFVARHV